MLNSKDNILIKTYGNLKDFLIKDLTNIEKKKHSTFTFCESCPRPVPSNALQEAVRHGCLKLQKTLPKSEVVNFVAVLYSIWFCCQWHIKWKNTKKYGSYSKKIK